MKLVPVEKAEIGKIGRSKYYILDALTEFASNEGVDAAELVDFKDHYKGDAATAAIAWARAIKRYGFRMRATRSGDRVFIVKLNN